MSSRGEIHVSPAKKPADHKIRVPLVNFPEETRRESQAEEQGGHKITIPLVDLAGETDRQVIVDRRAGQYLGHPTTVLLGDKKTILCVYPLGHGDGGLILRKSGDGGLTWGEPLAVPSNWEHSHSCPCIHRVTGDDGIERLFVFTAGDEKTDAEAGTNNMDKAMSQSMSLDNGRTWTPLAPNGAFCVTPSATILAVEDGKKHLVWYDRSPDNMEFTCWQSESADGGLTWSGSKCICRLPRMRPCEPAVIRSPEGNQLLCLMREDARWLNSLMMVSDDEGKTWSKPRELPASLTGDRHAPHYAPDGRLVVTFRDMVGFSFPEHGHPIVNHPVTTLRDRAHSPTKGDFVAWVGTYDDIINGREGQYRVRLLANKSTPGDTGYAGVELLPEGTFVATTYCVLETGQKPLVVSVRFRLDEIDARA